MISYYGAAGSHFPTASLLCAGFLLLQLGFSDVIEPQLSFRQNKHKPLVLPLLHHLFMLQTASSGSRKDDTASASAGWSRVRAAELRRDKNPKQTVFGPEPRVNV